MGIEIPSKGVTLARIKDGGVDDPVKSSTATHDVHCIGRLPGAIGPFCYFEFIFEKPLSGTYDSNYKTQECQITIIKRPSLIYRR